MAVTIHGHCLCGAVTIALAEPKRSIELCHCDMCRRWGGAFYSALSGQSFELGGEEDVRVYRSSEWATRDFCKICGSNIGYTFLPTGNRSFLAGLFADADAYPVESEIFVDEKPAWCDLNGDHPHKTGAEVIADAKDAGFDFD